MRAVDWSLLLLLPACTPTGLDCADGFYRDDAGNCQVIWPTDTGPLAIDTQGAGAPAPDGGDTAPTGGDTAPTGGDTAPPQALSTSVSGQIFDDTGALKDGFDGVVQIFPTERVKDGLPSAADALSQVDLIWRIGQDVGYTLDFELPEGSDDALTVFAVFRETYYGSSPELTVSAGSSRSDVDIRLTDTITPSGGGDGGSTDGGGTDTGLLETQLAGSMTDLLDVVELGDEVEVQVYLSDEVPLDTLPWESKGTAPVASSTVIWGGDGTAYALSFEELGGVEASYKVFAHHPLVYGAATEVTLSGGEASMNRDINLDSYLGR